MISGQRAKARGVAGHTRARARWSSPRPLLYCEPCSWPSFDRPQRRQHSYRAGKPATAQSAEILEANGRRRSVPMSGERLAIRSQGGQTDWIRNPITRRRAVGDCCAGDTPRGAGIAGPWAKAAPQERRRGQGCRPCARCVRRFNAVPHNSLRDLAKGGFIASYLHYPKRRWSYENPKRILPEKANCVHL